MSAKGYFADSNIEFINRIVLLCQNTPQCKLQTIDSYACKK